MRIRTRLAAAAALTVAAATAVTAGTTVATPTPAAATTPPTVAVIGDSYTAGALGGGPDRPDLAWYQYTVRDLGWRLGGVVADPGGGFRTPGVHGTFADALAAHPIPPWTNWVLVQGGLNDAALPFDPVLQRGGMTRLMGLIHAQAPGAQVVLIGAFNPFFDHTSTPWQLPAARTIGDPVAMGWSTRYIVGYMASYELGPDGVHPDPVGHQQIGHWVSWHLANALDQGPILHWNGSSWT